MSTDNHELDVQEGDDGSATVALPDDLAGQNEPQDDAVVAVDDSAETHESDEDQADDTDAVREARRARRRAKKDLVRKTNEEKDARLQMLQRQNEELMQRLSHVERRTAQNDLARMDKGIEDQQVRLEYAKMKLAEATSQNDGEAMAEAQNLWYEARQQLDQLRTARQQAEKAPQQQQRGPDPRVQRNASEWMSRNDWYRADGGDMDSRIAKQIDESLSKEGWDPKDPDYWDELDNRLQKYLPHRYNDDTSGRETSVRKPRNVVGSSGREASAAYGGTNRNTFTLSPERVRAMKEAGAWDNPERKKAMIAQFMKYDRQTRS